MVGRLKHEDNGPDRLARDKATAKTSNSLNTEIVSKLFSAMLSLVGLKAYPSRFSLQILLVEPYICEMPGISMYIDEITSNSAYLSSYALGHRRDDSDAKRFRPRDDYLKVDAVRLKTWFELVLHPRLRFQSQNQH